MFNSYFGEIFTKILSNIVWQRDKNIILLDQFLKKK